MDIGEENPTFVDDGDPWAGVSKLCPPIFVKYVCRLFTFVFSYIYRVLRKILKMRITKKGLLEQETDIQIKWW